MVRERVSRLLSPHCTSHGGRNAIITPHYGQDRGERGSFKGRQTGKEGGERTWGEMDVGGWSVRMERWVRERVLESNKKSEGRIILLVSRSVKLVYGCLWVCVCVWQKDVLGLCIPGDNLPLAPVVGGPHQWRCNGSSFIGHTQMGPSLGLQQMHTQVEKQIGQHNRGMETNLVGASLIVIESLCKHQFWATRQQYLIFLQATKYQIIKS